MQYISIYMRDYNEDGEKSFLQYQDANNDSQ